MSEKLEHLVLILAETTEEMIQRRERTERDLTTKGILFEKWIKKEIKKHAEVVVNLRNERIDIIPKKEYAKNPEKWNNLLSEPDIIIMWNVEPKIVIEAGSRPKGFYWNPYNDPKCKCETWNKHHVSIPQTDLKRYQKIQAQYPKAQYWVIIGKPNKIFAITQLEEWIKHAFYDYNQAFEDKGDNPEQSVICLKQTPHHNNIETWIKAVGMPPFTRVPPQP